MTALALRALERLFLFGGVASVSYGAWLASEPLGFVVAGGACLWLGLPD